LTVVMLVIINAVAKHQYRICLPFELHL